MRPPWGVTAVLLLGLVACSSDASEPNAGDLATPEAASLPVGTLREASVIGSGRATSAASADGAATVVATTIGVNVVADTGAASDVPSGIATPAAQIIVSPDGGYAVVEGNTGAELWSVEGVPSLINGFDGPTDGTFSADSSMLMTSSPTQVATAAITAEPQAVITAPVGTELGAATMTTDGRVIAAPVSGDGVDLITYSASTGAVSADIFVEPGRKVTRADFGGRPDRLLLQVTSVDPFEDQLVAWDPVAGQIVWQSAVGSFNPGSLWDVGTDGRILTTDGTTLQLIGLEGNVDGQWPLDENRTATAIVATATGYAVALSDSTLLLTGADGAPGGPSVSTSGRPVSVERLAGTDGVITVDDAGVVQSWGTDGAQLNEIRSYQGAPVNDVALSADDSSIAAATTAGSVTITDLSGVDPPLLLQHPEGNVDSVAFSPAGDQVVTGVGERLSDISFDDTVSTWNLDGLRTAAFGGEGEDVNGCANFRNSVSYSPSGDLFASSSHDFTVHVYRAGTAEPVTTLRPHTSTVLDIVFSPTGDRLVTSSDDGAVRVWATEDFTLQNEFVGPPGGYWSLAFMPDGTSLIASDLTGTMRRFDVGTGTEIVTLGGATTRTGRLAVSPDGRLVAAAADGNSVGIWSTESGALLSTTQGHASPVTSAVFSSDGSMLVTGSDDTTVRTWRVGSI